MAPPYMVQLCERLFGMGYNQGSDDDAILAGVCSNWFYQAYDHCSALLLRKPGCQKLWNKLLTLKSFIFPENATSLLSSNRPISIHPDLLNPANCQELANQVIKDYIHYIPRYMAIVKENHCLWLILRGIFGVIIIVLCVLIVARRYNNFQGILPEKCSQPMSLKQRLLAKNLKRVLYETKYLSVVPVIDPQLLHCGCPTLGLKIDANKFCDIQALLVRSVRRENAADGDSSQVLDKLKNFFQHSGKYRLIISLDLDCGKDESVKKPSRPTTPRSSGIPIHKPSKRIGIRRRL